MARFVDWFVILWELDADDTNIWWLVCSTIQRRLRSSEHGAPGAQPSQLLHISMPYLWLIFFLNLSLLFLKCFYVVIRSTDHSGTRAICCCDVDRYACTLFFAIRIIYFRNNNNNNKTSSWRKRLRIFVDISIWCLPLVCKFEIRLIWIFLNLKISSCEIVCCNGSTIVQGIFTCGFYTYKTIYIFEILIQIFRFVCK